MTLKSNVIRALRRGRDHADRLAAEASMRAHRRSTTTGPGAPVTNVVLPAAHGSLGDDALRMGTEVVAASVSRDIAMWVPDAPPHDAPGAPMTSVNSVLPTRTGFLSRRSREALTRSPLVMIGADTISGNYLHGWIASRTNLLRATAENGHRAALVNFSVSSKPTETARRLARSLPDSVELWARDQLSQERMQRIVEREVLIAPDVGAFAVPTPTAATIGLAESLDGRPSVVLSPNAHFTTLGWFDEESLVDYWIGVGAALQDDFEVVYLPHDLRDRPGDISLARRAVDGVKRRTGKSAHLIVPGSVGEAKAVLAASNGLISGRMHACVGALSSGVPTVGIEYLGKFAGQFRWYGTLGSVLPLEDSLAQDKVLETFETTRSRSDDGVRQPSPVDIGWLRDPRPAP